MGEVDNLVTLTNGHVVQPGCYADGSQGIYAVSASVRIAEELGFLLTIPDLALLEQYEADGFAAYEEVHEIADHAESFLNSITPGGYVWEWVDGEFFLSVTDA